MTSTNKVQLINQGKAPIGTRLCPTYVVKVDGLVKGIAHKDPSRGVYSFQDFTGSRTRLLAHAAKL